MSRPSLDRYVTRAGRLLRDPRSLRLFVTEVQHWVRNPRHALTRCQELGELAGRLVDLLRASVIGNYQGLSVAKASLVVAALIYLVVPTDAVPDVLGGVGLLDDVTLLGWVAAAVRGELDEYAHWRSMEGSGEELRG